MMFSAGKVSKEGELYNGPRSEEAFVMVLNDECGVERAVGGGLNEKAGRVEAWDKRILEYLNETGEKKEEIASSLKKDIEAASGPSAGWYAKALAKVTGPDGDAWLKKERKRFVIYSTRAILVFTTGYRLSALLKKEETTDAKVDELKTRLNILRAFVKKKKKSTGKAQEGSGKTREEL